VGIAQSRNIRDGNDTRVPTIFRLENTLSKCGSLLQLVSIYPHSSREDKVVSLVHDIFKQFVIDIEECQSQFIFQIHRANALIAMTSISYLVSQMIRMDETNFVVDHIRS
jgi:hypothetical protein